MKLSTFFQEQQRTKISYQQKLQLYHLIQQKKSKSQTSLIKRAVFHKQLRYSLMSLTMIFVFFGTYFWNNLETRDYRAFFSHKLPSLNSAQADQIAKIQEINWDYIIEKDGKQFHNSVLFDWDLITLKPNAKVIFNINESTQVEVKGPAQFSISKKLQGGYLLKLIDGEFFKITTDHSQDALTIETPKLSLETEKSQKINLELTKITTKLQVKNQGDPLLVAQKDEKQKRVTKTLASAKVLTVQENDINRIEDMISFSKSILAGNLTHTSSSSSVVVTTGEKSEFTGTIITWDKELLAIKEFVQEEGVVNTGIIATISDTQSSKKVPTEAQMSHISAALSSSFLADEVKVLYVALYSQDAAQVERSYVRFNSKIQAIAQNFTLPVPTGKTASELSQSAESLLSGLNSYHIPPTKMVQLKKLRNWFNKLKTQPTESWEDFSQHIPTNLKF